MTTTTFYFADLHFIETTTLLDFTESETEDEDKDEKELLWEYVSSNKPIHKETGAVWRFGKCRRTNEYIIGKFGKVYTEQPTTYDSDQDDFVRSPEDEEIADVSFFIIFFEEMAIAFNRKQRIGHKQFASKFAKGYNEFHNTSTQLSLRLMRHVLDLDEIFENADRVFKVHFDLVPTNPEAYEEMKILDDHIRDMNADEAIVAAATEDDLNTEEDFIRSGKSLVEADYGEATVGYEADGEEQEYNTKDNPATQPAENPEELKDVRGIRKILRGKINYLRQNRVSGEDSTDT